MKKSIYLLLISCFLAAFQVQAQECSEGLSMINSLFQKMNLEQALSDPDAITTEFDNLKTSVTSLSLNSLKKGAPRMLPMNGKTRKGGIRMNNKRTYVTLLVPNDELQVTLVNHKKLSGVEVVICGHDREGKTVAIENFVYPETVSETNKVFSIQGMKGRILSIAIKNKTSKTKFEYQIQAQ